MVRLFMCAQLVLCCGLSWAQSPTLRLPFPAGETWTVTCGYGCGFHGCGSTKPVVCGDGTRLT